MKMLWRWMIAVLFGSPLTGCVDVGRSLTSPTAIDLRGTWTGMLGAQGSGSALRLTWVANQSGNLATGPMTIVKPVPNVPATGPLGGVISSGDRVLLSYAVAVGSVSGLPSCSILGTGNGVVSGSTITGTMTLTFTSCDGANSGLAPPTTNDLSLTKQ